MNRDEWQYFWKTVRAIAGINMNRCICVRISFHTVKWSKSQWKCTFMCFRIREIFLFLKEITLPKLKWNPTVRSTLCIFYFSLQSTSWFRAVPTSFHCYWQSLSNKQPEKFLCSLIFWNKLRFMITLLSIFLFLESYLSQILYHVYHLDI